MPWGFAAGAVASIAGSVISSDASSNAADQQSQSAANADATQRYMYDTNRADNQPLLDTRNAALGNLNNLLTNPSSVTQDPGYQFALNQGTQAIDRSAASNGSLYSGETLKALTRYGQDNASNQLNQAYNRYSTAAGLGQVATNSNTQSSINAGNQIANNQTNLGNALAGNSLNQGRIGSNLAGQLGSYGNSLNWGGGGSYGTPTTGYVPSSNDLNSLYGQQGYG